MPHAKTHLMNQPSLSKQEFSELQSFVHSTIGIWLPDGKMSMVEQRIRPLVVDAGLHSFGEFLKQRLTNQPKKADITAFVDRITTNHTYFARETEHFEFLRHTVLPEICKGIRARSQGSRPILRMWCSAASRGHEPYTLAMIQRQFLGSEYDSWDAGLLATDISDKSLKFAIRGRYAEDEVRALGPEMQRQFFFKSGDEWEVNPKLKNDVLYRHFNLNSPRYSFRRPFDIVFCRNVLIYFDMPTKLDVVRKICGQMQRGGYLFVGLAESLGREVGDLKYLRPGIYQKRR